jgi:hypothetical protein
VKVSLKKLQNIRKKHIVLSLAAGAVMVTVLLSLLYAKTARASLDGNLSFGSLPGVYKFQQNGQPLCPGESKYDFCLNNSIFVEISDAGNNNTLDSHEAWTKSYIEPSRLSSAVIGIYDGKYSSKRFDSNGTNSNFTDTGVSSFEFYVGRDIKREDGSFDEIPCRVDGDDKPFLVLNSKNLSEESWKTIDVSEEIKKRDPKCTTPNVDGGLVTRKTNRIVIYVKARWNSLNGEGRVNAFKIGTAYTAGSGSAGLTGYYSRYASATTSNSQLSAEQQGYGQYAVQNRISDDAQGRYYFGFAPDCRLAVGAKERRYIKWKDVDYSTTPGVGYYGGLQVPRFRMVDTTTGLTVKDINGRTLDLSGAELGGPDQYKETQADFIGGHTYEWHWYNIVGRDGIAFWSPFDDFPSLVGGCGDYKHELTMKAGPKNATLDRDFEVGSEEDVAVNLTQAWSSTKNTAGPVTNVQLKVTPQTGSPSFTTTFENLTAGLGGHTVSPANVVYRTLQWPSEAEGKFGPLGPTPTFDRSRTGITARFKVKQGAQDGARYCLTATMDPDKNSDDSGVKVTPRSICFTIKNSLKPFLKTAGADVHAGDCNRAGAYPMEIKGVVNPARGSSGSYIVSAGGAITSFGSGNDPNGGNLTLGKGGKYGTMCRPGIDDLLNSINTEINLGKVQVIEVAGTSFDLGDSRIVQGGRYLVKFAGSPSDKVTGRSKASVTVYSPGNLTIASGFGSDTSVTAAKDKLPVVGVIARNIKISPSVGTIDATLYAIDNLDTCAGGTVASCKAKLTINGFAMAHDFSFKRTTGANGLNEAEAVNFNAAFYLNPSTGFTVPSSDVKYLGERAPLY